MRRFLVTLSLAWLPIGCTHGPQERAAKVSQIVRLGDSWLAIALVSRDTYRRPTGVAAFPDGGKWTYTERGAAQYLIDARTRDVRLLASERASDDLWESFEARIVGLEGDSVAYLRLSGCPRNGECYPPLRESITYRLLTRGELDTIATVPAGTTLPGTMGARRVGERSYVRFQVNGDTVAARFEEGAEGEPLFRVLSDGSLVALAATGPEGRHLADHEMSPLVEDSLVAGRVLENSTACTVDAACYLKIQFADTTIPALYGTGERAAPPCSIPREVSDSAFAVEKGERVRVVVSRCGDEGFYLRKIMRQAEPVR